MRAGLSLGVCMALCTPNLALSETPKPFATFEAKRIKAPKRGSLPVIDVQIDPEERQAALAPPPPPDAETSPDAAPNLGQYGWFWDKISPDLAQASAGRIENAINAVSSTGNAVRGPRLQDLQDIAKQRGIDILTATLDTDVSPALVLAVISVESAGRTDAESSAGAQGLMQLMPATAERFGVTDRMSAQQSIQGGVKYLDWLMKEFDSDPILALAGYNAGEGSVRKYAGVPPFSETRDYVPKVIAAFQVARGLCITPPQLASDGCVFAAMN